MGRIRKIQKKIPNIFRKTLQRIKPSFVPYNLVVKRRLKRKKNN